MERFNGQFAVVTGASRGIGYAIAKRLYNDGAAGIAILARNEEIIKKIAAELDPNGKIVYPFSCDIGDRENVKKVFENIYEAFGKIDILVNNAGITRDSMFHNMNDEQWDDVIKINLTGTFNCCKQVVPKMRQQKYGRILNMASCSPFGIVAGQANYSASKGGIIALTKTLAKELGRHNITVNAVAPGCIKTDMFNAIPEENLKEFLDKLIIQRLGEPDEVASLAAYLCSEESRYITGKCIACDGGLIPD